MLIYFFELLLLLSCNPCIRALTAFIITISVVYLQGSVAWLFIYSPNSCAWLWRPLMALVTEYLLNIGSSLLFLLFLAFAFGAFLVWFAIFDYKLLVFIGKSFVEHFWGLWWRPLSVAKFGYCFCLGGWGATWLVDDELLWRWSSPGPLWLCDLG